MVLKGGISRNWRDFLGRLPSLFLGFFLFALGIVANLNANLGMMPWGVLHVGIANVTPLTLGQTAQLVGLVIILIGWLLGFPPGFGTVANMYFIGFFIDRLLEWNVIPAQTEVVGQLGILFLSIIIMGLASFFYLRVRLGAGPRDGLMIGLIKKLGAPVSYVRGAIEITVVVLGFLLSGPIGLGTVVSALLIGYSVQFFFKLGRFDRTSEQMNLLQLYRYLKR